jgi:hypothetical protein
LESNWPSERGESGLAWSQARPAVRDAWTRVDTNLTRAEERDRQPAEREEAASRAPRVPK